MIVPEMHSESFYRVRQFYDSVWLATEGVLDADRRESIVYQLGAMLQTRAMTLSQYRQYVENLEESSFVDDQNQLEDFKDFSRLVDALQREAASIDVLAKSIRAMIR